MSFCHVQVQCTGICLCMLSYSSTSIFILFVTETGKGTLVLSIFFVVLFDFSVMDLLC